MTQLLGAECQKQEHSDGTHPNAETDAETHAETDITYKFTKFLGLSCANIALLSTDSVQINTF